MIPVSEALDHLLDLVTPLEVEHVPLAEAAGRVLAEDLTANRDQPPFAASAMDGYAVNKAEVELHAMFKVIGEAAAGHGFPGRVGAGQAVRIFTGAPVPEGASFVVIQEDVDRKGNLITIMDQPGGDNIRPAGGDFKIGDVVAAPKRLAPADIALLAAMNIATVPVRRKPDIALMSTGDELVMPGETPGPDQIIASNTFGLKALLEEIGASVRMLPIARDDKPALRAAFGLADGADLVVTIGGASVGDHDLVGHVAQELGLEQSFYKVAMRPGKPLMGGRMGDAAMIGLPGNPVSAMVCGHVFLAPVVHRMLGLPIAATVKSAPLLEPLSDNGPRAHYMRAILSPEGITPCPNQDSALLSVLASANALLIRPPHDTARDAGETVEYMPLG
ncbi:molybdopterin molybdenumtransferase MoeA [Epibacterium sp. SM1979]|uniref:Molybdopterin molybdenumtransferase n=1 Tax=Tritonibacter litoralis TaxID=2662264 RepID=A0A843Y794_9RHOB|nr:gephyrin-like molybdotransferase Glp [Tritonibacter litoralis]MQQ07030.1 molybdopterin molybdenumtransferase MoeA [Tritonibacter litoralis]